jgi:2-polyprenyl-3-methyl-5-hydroxy-6-metoxy-1,4-benzoquinol methylase
VKILAKLDPRIPEWDFRDLVERRCPFCGGEGETWYLRPDKLTVSGCMGCGAAFVSPAPSEEQLRDFYSRYQEARNISGSEDYLARYLLALEPEADFRLNEYASMLDLRGKQVLDVGCGLGETMGCLRKWGAEVTGLDLDPEAIRFVREKLGLSQVQHSAITELSGEPGYDLIILHDLLEHPLNPMEVLEKARILLKPGGLLGIWTPNGSCASTVGEDLLYRIDLEHMQYLSFKTCAYLSQILGLEVVHLESVGYPDLQRFMNLGRRRPPRETAREKIKTLVKALPGFMRLNAVRKALTALLRPAPDIRKGSYHLFCILRKPGQPPF